MAQLREEALHCAVSGDLRDIDDTSRDDPPGGPVEQHRACRITIIGGPEAGRLFESELALIRIGSAPGNDLVLHDRSVSRHHLDVSRINGEYHVVDRDSTNGLYLGTVRVREARLRGRAQLKIGGTILCVEPRTSALSAPHHLDVLIGSSLAIREVHAIITRIAPTSLPVLITGETGTGKELAARAIHQMSTRGDQAFVVLDCGTLPPTLIESALFGHEKGAFTGAERAYAGVFERAHRGTLFLDEVGEMPLELQPKLLRVLERGEVQRIGSDGPRKIDVRIVGATHRDLQTMIKEGRFRADLYYRLAAMTMRLPSLRERKSDLPEIANDFFARNPEEAPHAKRLTSKAIAKLSAHDWPGNVRELLNVLRHGAAFTDDSAVSAKNLPLLPSGKRALAVAGAPPELGAPFKAAKAGLVDRFEREYLAALVERHAHNLSSAAREAGIARRHLARLVDRYGLPHGRS